MSYIENIYQIRENVNYIREIKLQRS
jgi:hypothetical protein